MKQNMEEVLTGLSTQIQRFKLVFIVLSILVTIMGTVTMTEWMFEESLQTAGMGIWVLRGVGLADDAWETIQQLEEMTDHMAWFVNSFGWLSPINWGSFKMYVRGARLQLAAYRKWAAAESPAIARQLAQAKVIKVLDGDSLVLETGEEIRLAEIDAPEWSEPGGDEARRFLSSLVLLKVVKIHRIGRGYYGRTIANLAVDGQDVGALLVKAGLATPLTPEKVAQVQQTEGVIVRITGIYHAGAHRVLEGVPLKLFVPADAVAQVEKGLGRPLETLKGETLQVLGPIKLYKGEPEIVVEKASQLQALSGELAGG
jgi:hypothetical protein